MEHKRETGGSLLTSGADVVVRSKDSSLDVKVSGLLRSVIAASVTALGLDVRNGEVLLSQPLVGLRQLVGNDPDFLSSTLLDPGGHVELTHCDNPDTVDLVVISDGLGTQETSLLDMFVSFAHDNKDDGGDPQWNPTVRLGLKSDFNKAL